MKSALIMILTIALVVSATPGAATEPEGDLVVQLAPGVTLEDLPAGAVPLFDDWVRLPRSAAAGVSTDDPRFLVVQPDRELTLIDSQPQRAETSPFGSFSNPNDPFYADQWHIPMVGGAVARDIATGVGVVVAVLDTGLTTAGSEDLNCITPFKPYDAITMTAGAAAAADTDPFGHGTQVTSVIAECTDNNLGAAGVAPGVSVMPVKVLDESGSGDSSALAAGITWAVDNGADIINLSLGDPSCVAPCAAFPVIDAAIASAVAADVLIVAASGNNGGPVAYPANHPDVLAVGAVGADGTITNYSSRGPEVDLVAPGGNLGQDLNSDGKPDGILSESFDDKGWAYFWADGTSFAAPIVTAAAAMVMEHNPGAPAASIRAALESTAADRGPAGFDNTYGHGLLDAAAALGSNALVERLFGADRYSTAVAVSESEFAPGVPVAYIATGLDFPDALSAVPAAGRAGGPILLVPGTSIPGTVRTELTRLAPQSIVVLGGTAVVSSQVEADLAAFTTGSVTRLAGADRFATAAAVSAASFPVAKTVFIATGLSFPDALAGGPLGAVEKGPILLVSSVVPSATRAEIQRLSPTEIVILGGTGVVSASVAAELATLAPVRRVAGSDRYTTAIEAAEEAFPGGTSTVFIATGLDYPDALSGGPAAAVADGPIILVQPNAIPGSVAAYLNSVGPSRIVVLGGPAAVSNSVAGELQGYLK